MEQFQDLILEINKNRIDEFKIRLIEQSNSVNWVYQELLVENFIERTKSKNTNIFIARSPVLEMNNIQFQGNLFMWDANGPFEVFNITPTYKDSLSEKQYNHILNRFYNDVIEPISNQFELKVQFSKSNISFKDLIGLNSFHLLKNFSNLANKSNGHSHPLDFERWLQFVLSIHRSNSSIQISDFTKWLIENNWNESTAWKLGLDLDYALKVLKKYDKSS